MLLSRYLLDVSWSWGIMAGFLHAAVSHELERLFRGYLNENFARD